MAPKDLDPAPAMQRRGRGERLPIPVNMRDGSILAVGRGNPEWNDSAPHGAGRIMSRMEAKRTLDLEEYRRAMAGIYTTSVNEHTLDEAPMVYKSLEEILGTVSETVDIVDVMKPIYNFKFHGWHGNPAGGKSVASATLSELIGENKPKEEPSCQN